MTTGRAVDFSGFVASRCEAFVGRGWLLRKIRAFVDDDSDRRILVLHGEPGAGKTSVLAWAVREMGAAHFFFGRTDGLGAEQGGGWCEPIRCAETVGTQLVGAFGDDVAGHSRIGLVASLHVGAASGNTTGIRIGELTAIPTLVAKPVAAVRHEVDLAAPGTVHRAIEIYRLSVDPMLAMQELLVGPLRRAAAKSAQRMVLVLDGLDEWDRTAAPTDILELLQRSDLPPNVRVIASARPTYLSRLLPEVTTLDIAGTSPSDIDADISALIAEVESTANFRITTECRARIVQHSQGNFLVASCLLQALASGALSCDALPALPPGLDTFYRQSLAKLSDELARDGLRAVLGPVLSVLCVAREPLGASLIAKAAGLEEEGVRDVLKRLRAFIRAVDGPSGPRFIPFHISFSEFLRVDDSIIGASGELGHIRLVGASVPGDLLATAWIEASDYAVRHALAHCSDAGAAASRQMGALIDDPRYLLERVFRLGSAALGEDERLASQCGKDSATLHAVAVEMAVHPNAESNPRASLAQELAVIASAVRADGLAKGFSELATGLIRLVPIWSAGKDMVKFAASALRAAGVVRSAALLRHTLTLVVDDVGIEIWDLAERRRLHSMKPQGQVNYAVAEPSGAGVWYSDVDTKADTSRIVRLTVPDGQNSNEIRLDQAVTCLAIDDDGMFVVIGTRAGRIHLMDATTGQLIGHRDLGSSISRLHIQDRRAFALTCRRKVASWEIPSLERDGLAVVPSLNEQSFFADRTDGLAVSLDGKRAWIGGNDGHIIEASLDDATSAEPKKIVQLGGWADHLSRIDDGHLVAGDSTGRLHFINLEARRSLTSLRCHRGAPILAQYCIPLDLTVTVSERGEIAMWRTPPAKLDASVGHETEVRQVVFSGVTSRLFSIGADGSLHEWDDHGHLVQRAYLHPALFESVKLADDAKTLVTSNTGVTKFILSNLDTEFLRSEPWPVEIKDKCRSVWSTDPLQVAISRDGSLAVRCTPDTVELWRVDSAHLMLRFDGETHPGSDPISPQGAWLVTHNRDGKLLLRPIDQIDAALELESDGLLAGPFWSDYGLLILSTLDDVVQCHAIESKICSKLWTANREGATHGIACPDGTLCAVFSSFGSVSILRTSDGVQVGGFRGRTPITAAAFSSAGDRLAVGDAGGGIQMLGVTYGKDQLNV